MPSLQLISVNSMCTDWAERRVKPVVTATWQILWLAGQATAQVDWDGINKRSTRGFRVRVCDTACPCLAEYAYVLYVCVRLCNGCMLEMMGCMCSCFDTKHNTTRRSAS